MNLADLPAAATVQDLRRLLGASLDLPPEYRGGLSSHLPMALQSLQSLGASAERMQQFQARYVQRFEEASPPPRGAVVADWRAQLGGGGDAFAALLTTFRQALSEDGEDAVLRRVVPELLPGVAAAAFHGVIRTAHAIEAGHREELAAALAYWGWRWQSLAPPPVPPRLLAFDDWSARLADQSRHLTMPAGLISTRMAAAVASPTYQALAAALPPLPDLLPRLARLALERYLETRNFTVLHMITGLRALRVLSPWLGAEADLQPVLVRAFAAAHIAANLGADAGPAKGEILHRSWPEVIALAIASEDEHVVKLVHACRDEALHYGDARYLAAASLAVG